MKLDDAGETDDSWSRSVDVCLRRPCDEVRNKKSMVGVSFGILHRVCD